MRSSRRRLVVIFVVANGLLGAWWALQNRPFHDSPVGTPPSSATPPPGISRADDPVSTTRDRNAGRRVSAVAPLPPTPETGPVVSGTPPLPPLDAAFDEVFEDLDRRARAGDRRAACRLGFDLLLCREKDRLQAMLDHMIDSNARLDPATTNSIQLSNAIAILAERIRRAGRVCTDGATARTPDAWRYLARAAELGDHNAATYFVAMPPFDPERTLDQLDGWQFYRDAAIPLLERATAAGNPQALYWLRLLHSGGAQLHGSAQFVGRDAQRALVMALVLRSFADDQTRAALDEEIAASRAALPNERFARAEEEAERLRKAVFARQAPIDFAGGIFNEYDSKQCAKEG